MAATSHDGPKNWLYGPASDLLLGCGVLFMLVSAAFVVGGEPLFEAIPKLLVVGLVALVSAPHYGATIVRVYDQRADRQGYFLFSVVATLALIATAGLALTNVFLGSVLATVYLSWSIWHYTRQNFGISMMFLRRRGAAIDGASRNLLQASFYLSFAIAFVVSHGMAPGLADARQEIRFIPLGLPDGLVDASLPLLLALYAGTTAGWIFKLGRAVTRPADLAPPALIALLQAVWWLVPYLDEHYRFAGGTIVGDFDARNRFFPWIACAHAAQYLWVTSFYAKGVDDWRGQGSYYLKILVAGSAIWAIPAVLFSPGVGDYDWNFVLLVAATVNIHHFILDGAIWKLRNMKIASVLIRDVPASESAERDRSWVRRGVWFVAALGLLAMAHRRVEEFVIEPAARARQDWVAVAASLDRQQWHGVGSAFERFKLGRAFEKAGEPDLAAAQFEISAGMEPRVESIKRLIVHYQRRQAFPGFVRACDRLFELDHVPRPMETIDPATASRREREAFRIACLQTAKAARPVPPPERDATGGSGQGGGLLPADY